MSAYKSSGYKNLMDSPKSAQKVDFVDEKRTENRVYHRRKWSGSRVGVMAQSPKSLMP